MKIRYTRTGGVAGIRTSVEVDCAKLSAEQAAEIDRHIKAANIFHQPSQVAPIAPHIADSFHHVLEVTEGSSTHRISRNDSNISPELLKLFDLLHRMKK